MVMRKLDNHYKILAHSSYTRNTCHFLLSFLPPLNNQVLGGKVSCQCQYRLAPLTIDLVHYNL